MKKSVLCFGLLICLFLGCSEEEAESTASDILIAKPSEITLYYDIPGKVKLLYQPRMELKIAEGNHCVEFLTDPLETDAKGIAYLEMQAKPFECTEGRNVKVCDANDDTMCTDFTVRTTTKSAEIDTNNNLMIDEYETNTDKDLFAEYAPGDCTSYCRDDADCEDFCDSAIGYRCSTRCTSDDQCIKYKDTEGNWVSMQCRDDGRCAYSALKAVYEINKDNTTIVFGGKPLDENVTIDWGDGTEVQKVPMSTNNDLSHTYQKKGQYKILLTGEYIDWTAGCSDDVELFDIYQFGPVGLGYNEDAEHGTFWNCFKFNKISAKDIPDASKLTDMSYMFAGSHRMYFNNEAITRWDTSNVKAMRMTFLNAGEYHGESTTGFNQDIGRWNTAKVKTMQGLFYCDPLFNQNINCWDVSKVKDISNMFGFNVFFTQILENWNLVKVTQHDEVFTKEGGKHRPSGRAFDISIKAYCTLRNKLHNEDIGRNSHQCWQGATYATACNNDAWKTRYDRCKDHLISKYPEMTEDMVSCAQLRNDCD